MLWTLISEAFEDLFRFDSKAWRTAYALLFKPGFLTQEYFAGRRARYVQPIRLYLITSLAFFLTVSIMTFFSSRDDLVLTVDGVQTEGAWTEEVGADGDPVQGDPVQGDPVQGGPVQGGPVQGGPIQGGPVEGSKLDSAEVGATKKQVAAKRAAEEIQIQKDELAEKIRQKQLNLPLVSTERTEKIRQRLSLQADKAIKTIEESPEEIISILIDIMPPIIFCLLPIFALLLKLFYMFQKMYYTEHLVLAVHNHCFLFVILLAQALISIHLPEKGRDNLGSITFLILAWYMYQSLRVTFQQSHRLTAFKYVGLLISYAGLMLFGFISAMVIGVMTL